MALQRLGGPARDAGILRPEPVRQEFYNRLGILLRRFVVDQSCLHHGKRRVERSVEHATFARRRLRGPARCAVCLAVRLHP